MNVEKMAHFNFDLSTIGDVNCGNRILVNDVLESGVVNYEERTI